MGRAGLPRQHVHACRRRFSRLAIKRGVSGRQPIGMPVEQTSRLAAAMRAAVLSSACLLLMAGLAWYLGWRPPAAWNPWAVLDVRQPPNLLTPYKLARLRENPGLCQEALQTSALRYRQQADSAPTANCPLRNVWRIEAGEARLSSSFLASCPLAVAYALFEERIMDPRSGAFLNSEIADYRLPRLGDIGEFVVEIYEPESERARGVIGLGEPPVIGPGAAISNAVANALGVRVPVLPLTPKRVLDTLQLAARNA